MSDLNKKITLELLVTPLTMCTGIGGASLLLLSPMLGPPVGFAGFLSLLVCGGVIAKNFLFDLEVVAARVAKQFKDKEEKQEDITLDELDKKLITDRDPRDQTALRNLRSLYDSFMEDHKKGKINNVSAAMIHQIDEIFDAVVLQLKHQFDLYETSTELTGNAKDKILQQREEIILEVEKSINDLATTISEMRALKIKTKKGELSKLQQRLSVQLEAAKAVDEFTSSLDGDLSRFDEYKK